MITYEIKLYKDGVLLATRSVAEGIEQYNFAAEIATAGPGSYTTTVQAKSDDNQAWRDGPVSELSDGKVVA